jgi:hypothetical protein
MRPVLKVGVVAGVLCVVAIVLYFTLREPSSSGSPSKKVTWGKWSECSQPCGPGHMTRKSSEGKVETKDCKVKDCEEKKECKVGEWGDWGECDKPCGGGTRTRTRTVTNCPGIADSESGVCNTEACDADCVVSEWSEWGVCDSECGGGKQSRTRTIVTPARGNGVCPILTEYRDCNTNACVIPCVVSEWSEWGPCDSGCGGGTQSRTRTIITPGANCPPLIESRACNTEACCSVSDWSDWSACDKPCGSGKQTRTRTITTPGANCPSLTESRDCNTDACAIPCAVSEWSEWSTCDNPCGGKQSRTRTITTPGVNCPSLTETKDCGSATSDLCKRIAKCVVGAWSTWSDCSLPCGPGTKTRTRTLTGNCDASKKTVDTDTCNKGACCVVSEWKKDGSCSKPCGGGIQTFTRTASKTCPPTVLAKTEPCNTDPCPCVPGDWGKWSDCTKTCGGGTQTRTRTLSGACGADVQTREMKQCNTTPCRIPCVISPWVKDGDCSKPCGDGIQTYKRTVTGDCPPTTLSKTESCNKGSCCVVSDWKKDGKCSKPCGGGVQLLTRTASKSCPPTVLSKTEDCNTDPCPCVPGPWGPWSVCSQVCGGGTQSRTRVLSGTCGPDVSTTETQICNNQSCPPPPPPPVALSCTVTDNYRPWGPCSRMCGGGTQTREKIYLNDNGHCPPAPTQTQACNTAPCDPVIPKVNCVVGDWGDWGTCQSDCTQTRTKAILTQPSGGGLQCPLPSTLTQSRPCFGQGACKCKINTSRMDSGICICKNGYTGPKCDKRGWS